CFQRSFGERTRLHRERGDIMRRTSRTTGRHPGRHSHLPRLVKLALAALMALLSRRSHAADPKVDPAFDLDAQTRVLDAVVYRQVAILPIVRKAGAPVDTRKYLTLEEGLRTGK